MNNNKYLTVIVTNWDYELGNMIQAILTKLNLVWF